ncbi:MAG: hypothetical protein GQ558_03390, partial [Thermoplasmata archaeon]|nr:hypothetical protein [Thermoplasmata archaeon]
SDGDLLPDGWEVYFGLDPNDKYTNTNPSTGPTDFYHDWDNDRLTNGEEWDHWENEGAGREWTELSDPRKEHTDTPPEGNGRTDYDEINIYGTSPNDGTDDQFTDGDSDGMDDAWEAHYDPPPGDEDLDPGDNEDSAEDPPLMNLLEFQFLSDPNDDDEDGDGMSDYYEYMINQAGVWPVKLRPDVWDDYEKDHDRDGMTTKDEIQNDYEPWDPDMDGDNMLDGWEDDNGFDPEDPDDAPLDSDSDGLTNLDEFYYKLEPRNSDTDDDGFFDGFEYENQDTDEGNFDPHNTNVMPSGDKDGDGLLDFQENRGDGTEETRNLKMGTEYPGPGGKSNKVMRYGTDYDDVDSDDDALWDGEEALLWGDDWDYDIDFDYQAGEVTGLSKSYCRNNMLDKDSDGDVVSTVDYTIKTWIHAKPGTSGQETYGDRIIDFPPYDGYEYAIAKNMEDRGKGYVEGKPDFTSPDLINWEGQNAIGNFLYDPRFDDPMVPRNAWCGNIDHDTKLNWVDEDVDQDGVDNDEDSSPWGLRLAHIEIDRIDYQSGTRADYWDDDWGEFFFEIRIGGWAYFIGYDEWDDSKNKKGKALKKQQKQSYTPDPIEQRESDWQNDHSVGTITVIPNEAKESYGLHIKAYDYDSNMDFDWDDVKEKSEDLWSAYALMCINSGGIALVYGWPAPLIYQGIIFIQEWLDKHDVVDIAEQGDVVDLNYYPQHEFDLYGTPVPMYYDDVNNPDPYHCGYWEGSDGETESNFLTPNSDNNPGHTKGDDDNDGELWFHSYMFDVRYQITWGSLNTAQIDKCMLETVDKIVD